MSKVFMWKTALLLLKALSECFCCIMFVMLKILQGKGENEKISVVLFIKCKFNHHLLAPVNNICQVLPAFTQGQEGKAIFYFYLNV